MRGGGTTWKVDTEDKRKLRGYLNSHVADEACTWDEGNMGGKREECCFETRGCRGVHIIRCREGMGESYG